MKAAIKREQKVQLDGPKGKVNQTCLSYAERKRARRSQGYDEIDQIIPTTNERLSISAWASLAFVGYSW